MTSETASPPAGQKTLVIAEKPSVAADIARALGGMQKKKDFFEGGEYVVSSAIGHLLEMTAPEKFEAKRGKWTLANLPVLPDYFDLRPVEKTESRLKLLERLYRRRDIAAIVNACDAGREGELIFHNIARYITAGKKTAKPVSRLWLSSMTPAAIREGFANLCPADGGDAKQKNRRAPNIPALRAAALSRAEADWLVGINATRAMTALNSGQGGFFLTTVGRVQTPTLALIVSREKEIRAFVVQNYWEARAIFKAAAGEYEGVYVQPGIDKKPERVFEKTLAEKVCAECEGKTGVAKEKKKPQSEIAPPLFDLTSLQREANARHGLPAKVTLAAAQALYEKHKAVTYPRTDSKNLPEDYPPVVAKALAAVAESGGDDAKFAKTVLENNWARGGNRRIYNNAKVSDHFAIIPTGAQPKPSWRETEAKVYKLILRRFLAVWYPPAKYEVTERATTVGEHRFETKGRVLLEAGWREVGGVAKGKDAPIAPVTEGETVAVREIHCEEKQTKPPPRYTEATLLSAMESAGKFVEEEELREAMRERGLGTPATRASIIEELLRREYIVRDRRDLLPTRKADDLMEQLRRLKIESLTLPAMTGEWEYKLRQIERAERKRETLMDEIRKLSGDIVDAAKSGDAEKPPEECETLAAPCPACGAAVRETGKGFACESEPCGFFLWRVLAGRKWAPEEISELISKGELPEISGFRSKKGRDFSAAARLEKGEDGKHKVAFVFANDSGANAQTPEDIAAQPEVGDCPKCGAKVRNAGNRYSCERAGECDFSIYGRILQQELAPEQMKKLLGDGKTDFLNGFVSKKTGRPFKARLTMDPSEKTGKFSFEFAPRPGGRK